MTVKRKSKKRSWVARLVMGSTGVLVVLLAAVLVNGVLTERSVGEVVLDPLDRAVDAAIGSYDCTVNEVAHPEGSYTGPLLDAHIHIGSIPDGPVRPGLSANDSSVLGQNVTIADYVCMMDRENTESVLAFFPVWEPIVSSHLQVVERTMEEYGDRFYPFIMPPQHDNDPDGFPTVDADTLREMLRQAPPGLFVGYGEIGLYAREGGAAALEPNSQRMRDIYAVAQEFNLAVYVHLEQGHMESFSAAVGDFPHVDFIFHGDQLVLPGDGVQDLSLIDELLTRHPNLYYGVDELYGDVFLLRPDATIEEFTSHLADADRLLEEDVALWKEFIERHPDQVMWDTDRGWSTAWSVTNPEVTQTLTAYARRFIALLDPAVQERFAYGNAKRLLER